MRSESRHPQIISIDSRLKIAKYNAKLQAMDKGGERSRVTVPSSIINALNMRKGQWVNITVRLIKPKNNGTKKSSWNDTSEGRNALASLERERDEYRVQK